MAFIHSPKIVTDGLVLALDAGNVKSYPGSGTTWLDKSGRGNNGTLINGPTFNSANGGYIRCDGINDFIEISDNSSLDFGSGSFTVEYWFRKLANTFNFSNIWGPNKWNTGASPGTNEWYLGIGNGSNATGGNSFRFAIESGSTVYGTGESSTLLSSNTWYQLIGQRDGASLKVYLNGTLNMNVSPSGLTTSTTINNIAGRNLRINNSALNALYTNADNAILRIYNKALSPDEVLQNYNATKGRFGL
jgi:hypothetical protein